MFFKNDYFVLCYVTPDVEVYPEYIKSLSFDGKRKTINLFSGEKDIKKVEEALQEAWVDGEISFVFKGKGKSYIRWVRSFDPPYDPIIFDSKEEIVYYFLNEKPKNNNVPENEVCQYLSKWINKMFIVNINTKEIDVIRNCFCK